jgi:hypothetical protein
MIVSEDKIKLARPAGEAPGGGHHLLVWHDQRGQFRLVERLDRNDKRQPIELAKLRPKDATDKGLKPDGYRASVWVVPPAPKDGPPLIVRGAYGLGQVMLVALDLDQMPFSDKGGDNSEKDFWQMFRVELGTEQKAAPNPQAGFGGFYPGYNMDVATRLQQSLEDFEDIPVIGFGWVALFILLYIVVVGPLEYLFLKKVLKRLELTWVTFPVVVVLISVLAYFTAYWIKGDKLKINKVDLVDIDLQTEQAYGNTWFTLFSPRIDHYTIGVEPVAPEWAPAPASDPVLLVSWMDRPEENPYGSGRTRSQSLFRRTYDYEPNATALRGVPIQVWSTKTFTARWQVPARKQMFSHTLKPALQSDRISGTITSHLPVELTEVVFFYRGRLYEVGRLLPNVETRLDDLQRNARGLDTWYQSLNAGPMEFGYGRRRQQHREPTEPLMKWILFYRDAASIRSQENAARDSSLRYLDQSWQLRNLRDEVIIYGRVPVLNGEAQKISEDPGSPSRLWLHQLPKPGEKWPGLSGTLRQETFVRVFIPLQSHPPVAEGRD